MLVENPAEIERQVHKDMRCFGKGREWFGCSVEDAVAAIQRAAGGRAICETFKRADRARAEHLRKEREQVEARQRAIKERLLKQEEEAQRHYTQRLAAEFPEPRFWPYWLGCSIAIGVVLGLLFEKRSDWEILWSAIIGGALVGFFLKEYVATLERESPAYRTLLEDQEARLQRARTCILWRCSQCQKVLSVDATQLTDGNVCWQCPTCNTVMNVLESI